MSNAKVRARLRRKRRNPIGFRIDETFVPRPGMTAPPVLSWTTTTEGAPKGHHFVVFQMVPRTAPR